MTVHDPPVNLDPLATYDAQHRKQPHALRFLHYARSMPWLLAGFDRPVPDEFLFQADTGVLEVACPCGATPRVTPGQAVDCRCGRWFLSSGARVLVNRPSA